MATIIEKTKDGKIISFKFRVSLGRDENKRQIIRCTTWHPDKEMSKSKSRKEAEKRASIWEQKVKQEYLNGKKERQYNRSVQEPITLSQFANNIWMPLAVNDGEHCNSTVEMYQYMLNVILPFFHDTPLHEITPIQITQYLQWLRKEYQSNGKRITPYKIIIRM